MAKKKVTGKQLEMSFNSSAKTSNGGRAKRANVIKSPAAPKKATPPTPPAKATPPAAPKKATPPKAPNTGTSPATAVKKSNTYVKDRVKRTDALRGKTFKTEADIAKRKVEKLRTGNPLNNKGKAALDLVKKASKGKDIKGKAMLAVYGTAALIAAATAGVFDKKKGTAIKAEAKKPVKTPTKSKTDSKKPVTKTSNPKFVKGYIEGLEREGSKKPAAKKPVTSSKVIGAVKATITGKNTNKIETNLKKPATKTDTKVDNTSIEQKAKDVMRGKYGSGADRKKALGADYDKVQAIINKQMASSKPKTAPAKTVTAPAAPEKMEIKKAQPIEYKGPTELAIPKPVVKEEPSRMEQKREDRKEAKGYRKEAKQAQKDAEKEEMKKGGTVKMQYGGTSFSTPTKKISGTKPIGKPIPLYTGQKSNSTTKKVVDSGNQITGKKTIAAQKKYGGVIKSKK